MLSGLVVCVLVVGAIATKPGMPIFGATHGGQEPSRERHEPCCAPRYFTSTLLLITTEVYDGSLSVEYLNAKTAYDSVGERVSVKSFGDFFNGTEISLKAIVDYKKDVSYLIVKHGEEEICFKSTTTGRFPKECIPEDAHFIGEVTLGDQDLDVNSFYFSTEDEHFGRTDHVVTSVQPEGCVPVSFLARTFDTASGREIRVNDARVFDFSLGICDPEEYFKPPPSCDEGRALDEPTPQMLKMRRKGLFY